MEALSEIAAGGTDFATISRGLEVILFHRLRKDTQWSIRKDFSSLLEQLQLSQNLGK